MKINIFAEQFVRIINADLLINHGPKATLPKGLQKQLQNLVVIVGNGLVGDVTSNNISMLQKRVIDQLNQLPIKGIDQNLIESCFTTLGAQLNKEKPPSKL